jgi:hypothetical protein
VISSLSVAIGGIPVSNSGYLYYARNTFRQCGPKT